MKKLTVFAVFWQKGEFMYNVLVVEDEVNILKLMNIRLTKSGFNVFLAENGEQALAVVKKEEIDIIVADVMMPVMDGFEMVELLRAEGKAIPVIFVTAKDSLSDKLAGLYLGGDDYIVKPVEILELIARVETVLRRTSAAADEFSVDDVVVNLRTKRVTKGGEEVYLTPREFSLLETFIINRNIALSREKLIELIWASDFDGDVRTVDVHIQRLRTKLDLGDRIKTLYRLGYRFEV